MTPPSVRARRDVMEMAIGVGRGRVTDSVHESAVASEWNGGHAGIFIVDDDVGAGARGLAFRNKRLKRASGCMKVFIEPGLPAIKRNEMMESIKEIA
jgi:hypothetical protein